MTRYQDRGLEVLQCGAGTSVVLILHDAEPALFSKRVAALLSMDEVVTLAGALRGSGKAPDLVGMKAVGEKGAAQTVSLTVESGIASFSATDRGSRDEKPYTCRVAVAASGLRAYVDSLAVDWLAVREFGIVGLKGGSVEEKAAVKAVASIRARMQAAGVVS